MHLTACLQSRGEPPIVETVMIVNISSHGARVLSHRNWQPHEQLVLTELVGADVASAAVQAYAAPTCITALFAVRERPLRHLIAVPSGGARTPSGHAAPGPGARESEPGAVCSAASGNS